MPDSWHSYKGWTDRVYVGGLPPETIEKDLEEFFDGFGKLKQIILHERFAFVEFEEEKHAKYAVLERDGDELLGVRVTVKMARKTTNGQYRCSTSSENNDSVSSGNKHGPLRTKYRVIVQNLSSRVSWQTLKDFMREAAPVVYADVERLNPNQGIVEFTCYSDMKVAIEKFDGTELDGRQIRLVADVRPTRLLSTVRSRSRTRYDSNHSNHSEGCNACKRLSDRSPCPDSDTSRSSSRSRNWSRSMSAESSSMDECFDNGRRAQSVCSDNSCNRIRNSPFLVKRSQSLPGRSYSDYSLSVGSDSRSVSANSDMSRTLSIDEDRTRSFSVFSDDRRSSSRSRSRTLSAYSDGSRSRSPSPGISFRVIGPRTPSSRSRSRSGSRSLSDEMDVDTFDTESYRPSRPRTVLQIRHRSRSYSVNHELESRSRKRRARSLSEIPAKRFLLDETL